VVTGAFDKTTKCEEYVDLQESSATSGRKEATGGGKVEFRPSWKEGVQVERIMISF